MTAPSPPPRSPRHSPWKRFDAHHRLGAAIIAAVVVALTLPGRVGAPIHFMATWDAFAVAIMALAWAVILTQDPYEMRRAARLEDASSTFLFSVVVIAAGASLLAVFMTLGPAKALPKPELAAHLAVAISTVVLSWALVHTIFAMRYAHAYYSGARDRGRHDVAGGLIFPEEKDPDYFDFAYFSFVIGMTCQVSDVQISGRRLRRTVLWHGLIAFGFNTAILALFVNIVAGLL